MNRNQRMANGHWIKKLSLFFSCTTTMLSFRLVISTAGFCAIRFHIDCSYIDILISRLLNAALIAHQIGNWLGVVAISVAAATTNAALKVYALVAANWLCLSGMCFALIFLTSGETGKLTSFYWSMTSANLFHKTSEAVCLEIAPCFCKPKNNVNCDATNYCVASFVASTVFVSLIKVVVLALIKESFPWRQLSVHSRPLGEVTVTIRGRRSVKMTIDYRAAKWLYIITVVLTFLMCVVWSVILLAGYKNPNNSGKVFRVNWSINKLEACVVCGILGVVPGAAIAAVVASLFWWVVWVAYSACRTRAGRGIKWAVVIAGVIVAIRVMLMCRHSRRPKLNDYNCHRSTNQRNTRHVRRLIHGRYEEGVTLTSPRILDMKGQNTLSLTHPSLLESNLETVHHEIKDLTSVRFNELEQKLKVIEQTPDILDMSQHGHPTRNRRSTESGENCVYDLPLETAVSQQLKDKWETWWKSERPNVVKELQHSMDNAAKEVKEAVTEVRATLQKVNKAAEKVETTAQEVRSTMSQVQEVRRLVGQANEQTTKAAASALEAAKYAETVKRMAEGATNSAHQAEKHAASSNKSAQDAVRYAQYAWIAADRSAHKADIAATSAKEAQESVNDATLLTVEAFVSAEQSAKSAENAEKSASLSAVTSVAAMGTASTSMVVSAAAISTSTNAMNVANNARKTAGQATEIANYAQQTATEAKSTLDCGVSWMKKKVTEIFGVQEDNEGRRWKVIVGWGIIAFVIIVAVVGLSDTERDWRDGISEEEMRTTCNMAALVGGVLGLATGSCLGAFAKKFGVRMGMERYGKVHTIQQFVDNVVPVWGLTAGLAAGTAVGLYIGMFLGLIIGAIIGANSKNGDNGVYSRFLGRVTVSVPSRKAKLGDTAHRQSVIFEGMVGGALVGAAAGVIAGLAYQAATDTKPWPQKWAVAASLVMDIFGMGTVYSIYPGMAPCSITQFQYFDRIDAIILTLSASAQIVFIVTSEFSGYGPEQKWDTKEKPSMRAWYGGLGLPAAQFICQIIVINVLQHPGSKLAQQVTSSPWRAGILTVIIVTSGQITATIGYPGIVANSNYKSATIMLNNTATLAMMQCTSVIGEGYLTELKKYEPGHRPTQGMGKWDTYWWWNGKAFINAWQIWCCIGTTDLRRDIMLCKN